ncbi:NUDIX domain-containing protein [Streptomyces sp. ISL-100]|uniref:NUDIX hydrolase n=1 Tax=Streptomyces sp. ISL-100 TaxID=2819173 RepID=UPI001BE8F2AF|nr:NUDIX domain-containing protein [Streptomyces sp. ISL-100]MBT2401865.1 NUDIX domain-containing protein [Streptomyces sp. ISL-100]
MDTVVRNVIGGHLYLEREGTVLLGKRHPDAAFAPSTWHLLAGHCEFEAVRTCVAREAAEESGLQIDEQDLRLVHTVHVLDPGSTQPRLQMFFAATRWTGEPELREPDRCTEWRWWPLNALPDQLVEYTRVALKGIARGSTYTQMGWPS